MYSVYITDRCIYNKELEDAIKSHGKIFVHTGPAGGSEPPVTTTVDSICQENAPPASVQVDSADRGSIHIESASSVPTKLKPVFSVMPDESRPDAAKMSKAEKPQKVSKPPVFDAELRERGINCFLC